MQFQDDKQKGALLQRARKRECTFFINKPSPKKGAAEETGRITNLLPHLAEQCPGRLEMLRQ